MTAFAFGMGLFKKTYAELVADLENLKAQTPHVRAGTLDQLQKRINDAGLAVLLHEVREKFPEARALLQQNAILRGHITRVEAHQRRFQSEKGYSEENLSHRIAYDTLGSEDIRHQASIIETTTRCLKVVTSALQSLNAELAKVETAFAKLPAETRRAVQELDPLANGDRSYFESFFTDRSIFAK